MESQTVRTHVVEFLEFCNTDDAQITRDNVNKVGINKSTLGQLVGIRDTTDGTFLHWAAREGHEDLFQLAAKNLASESWHKIVNVKDKFGCTILHWACRCNHRGLVKFIHENVNISALGQLVTDSNRYGVTCLHWASQYGDEGIVQILAGLNNNKLLQKLLLARDERYGATALHWASRYGNPSVVRVILKKANMCGVAQELIMTKTLSAASQISDESHDDIAQEFNSLCPISKGYEQLVLPKTNGGSTALHWACIHGHLEVIKAFLQELRFDILKQLILVKDDVYGNTAIHWACGKGHSDVVKVLVKHFSTTSKHHKYDVLEQLLSTKSNDGNIALHWAYGKGHIDVVDSVADSLDQEALTALYKIQNNKKETVLHWACNTGQAEVVRRSLAKLPRSESMLMTPDENGCTALHSACLNGDPAVVSAILESVNAQALENLMKKETNKRWSALHCACDNVDSGVMEKLVENLSSQLLLKLINKRDHDEIRAFDLAVKNKHFDAIAAILSSKPTFFEENLQAIAKDTIVDACKRGSDKAVLNILNAADQSDRTGKLLYEFLNASDDDGRTVLHIACDREEISLIKKILAYIQKLSKITLSNNVSEIMCRTDTMGRSVLLECTKHADNRVVQMLLDAATRCDCVKSLLIYSFLDAFDFGCNDLVLCILNQAVDSKCIEDILFCVDRLEQTVVHHACMNNYDRVRTLKTVLRMAQTHGFLIKLLCHEDVFGRTFLSYIENANDDVIQLIISKISDCDSPHKACTWFLTKPDVYGKTAIHCTPESRMYLLTHFLTPFYENLKDDVIPKAKCSVKNQPLIQRQHSVNVDHVFVSKQPRTMFRDFQETSVVTQRDQYEEVVKRCRPSSFTLVHESKSQLCGKSIMQSDLLTVIGDAKCLDLIQHNYIQAYLEVCWRSHISYVFFPYLVLYMASLLSLTACVISRYTEPIYLVGENSTEEVLMISSLPPVASYLNECFLVTLASLVLICEFLQMIAKGRHYWQSWSNYADLAVCFGSFVVACYSVYIDYNVGLHHLGIIIMCVAWVNAAWTVSKISFGKFKPVSLLFIKLFRVLKSVVIFLPVILVFILTMSFGYSSLLHNQKPFSNIGYSVMKTMAMTIGELDFDGIFMPDDNLQMPHFYIMSCVFFLVFLAVMNIALINLLVGTAVGDINELNSQSEVVAFNCIVDLSKECHATSRLFTRLRPSRCCRKSYKAVPVTSP